MKTCSKANCQQTNPQSLDNFTKDKKAKDGLQSQCNHCRNEVKRLDRLANPEKYHEIDKARWGTKKITSDKWRENNRERYNASMREYRKKNYQKLRLQRYDLTPEQHAKILLDQKGVCAVCSKLPQGKRPLVVDHDHVTDEVRGLLCYKCNRDMVVVDDKEHLAKLVLYRDKKHQK